MYNVPCSWIYVNQLHVTVYMYNYEVNSSTEIKTPLP